MAHVIAILKHRISCDSNGLLFLWVDLYEGSVTDRNLVRLFEILESGILPWQKMAEKLLDFIFQLP